MNYLHSKVKIAEDQVAQVKLAGNAANVFLVDDSNYEKYKKGEKFDHAAGGYYTQSPVRVKPPKPGEWNLVVDLGGRTGEVHATVSVESAKEPAKEK